MIRLFVASLLLAIAGGLAEAAPLGPDGNPGRTIPGKFIWLDLATDDPAGARAFDRAVFGWRFHEAGRAPGSYALIENAGGKVGGVFRQPRPTGAPVGSRWLSLISVGSAERTAQYVRGRGGQVLLAPQEVPGRGIHAVFSDPEGAAFGVLSASGGDPPDGPVGDGEVFWVDLFAREAEKAAAFYAGLAGYEIDVNELVPGGKHRIFATGGFARAGIWPLPQGTSAPGWLPYMLVEDVPAVLTRARAAGGRVLVEPRADILDGNVAVIADPNGGAIGVINWEVRAAAREPAR
jgi:predicted enzyme related to lactoylglutathione lyase